jgi:Rrf2 family protein
MEITADKLTLQFQTTKSRFCGMISSTATYALRAVVYLAGQPGRYVSATVVPHEYLLKVLNLLDHSEIVESRRGPGGGYRLRMSAAELTCLDVIRAIESIPRITNCPLGIGGHKKLCPLHQLLDQAARCVEESFAEVRISDLLPRKRARHCDFTKTRSRN